MVHTGFEEALTKPTKEIPQRMGVCKFDYCCQVCENKKLIKSGTFHFHPSIWKKRIVNRRNDVVRRKGGW